MLRGPLLPTLALSAGILISSLWHLPWWSGAVPVAIALSVAIFLRYASKDPVAAFRISKWHIVWVVVLFFGIGLTDESLNRPVSLEEAYGGERPGFVTGVVTGVLTKTYGDRIDVSLLATNGAKARIRSDATMIAPGDIVTLPASMLKEVEADTTAIGRRVLPALKSAGILYTGRIPASRLAVEGRSSNPRFFFIRLRERIETSIERSHLQPATAAFLNAILMGDKTGLDEETRLTFANGGMAHMLALSGLHIGILAGFMMLLLWPLKLVGRYKSAYAVAILLLWIYVAVTGMSYSSVRACVMTTFAFVGIMAERKNFASNALCSACLLILIADPGALFDAGFQLSVVCVGALIAFATRLNPVGHRHHPTLYSVCGAVIATIVATAASWALISYYFSQVPMMFLPSNLLLLPLLPIYLAIGAVYSMLVCLGVDIDWLAHVLDIGYSMLLNGIEWLSGGTEFVIPYQIPLWGVLLWMLLLASGAYAVNRKEMK